MGKKGIICEMRTFFRKRAEGFRPGLPSCYKKKKRHDAGLDSWGGKCLEREIGETNERGDKIGDILTKANRAGEKLPAHHGRLEEKNAPEDIMRRTEWKI